MVLMVVVVSACTEVLALVVVCSVVVTVISSVSGFPRVVVGVVVVVEVAGVELVSGRVVSVF